MIIDSHCHLASHQFPPHEVPELIDRALQRKVSHMVTLATGLDNIPNHLHIAQHPNVHTCVGIHPCDVHHAPDDAIAQIEPFCLDPRVCAIGETGLDYYHPAPESWCESKFRERQQAFLYQHFDLAVKTKLNLVIHTRDRSGTQSFDDALNIYREFHHSTRAVFHCFISSWENAKKVLDLGGLVSFGGVTTFKNAKDVLDTAIKCPPHSFMLETDSPYLAPIPHRGKRNEPSYVADVCEFLAPHRHESPETLAQHTSETAKQFFRFRPLFD